jgi:hypothetical protein
MKFLERISGFFSLAKLHDAFLPDRLGPVLFHALNVPMMPVAAILTYSALLTGAPGIEIVADASRGFESRREQRDGSYLD